MYDFAYNIVKKGLEAALRDFADIIPTVKFGKAVLIDKYEIESTCAIADAISAYTTEKSLEKPLSIGVFGSPGSGKPFIIKEIIGQTEDAASGNCTQFTFNVSQFQTPGDLLKALRIVQNENMNRKLPIVFWDEFDSMYENKKLGWLRFFLAPMEDGSFTQDQHQYTIGRAIFIFAGGTCTSMREFITQCKENGMIEVKAPDFLSRLAAFLDISSINPSDEKRLCGAQNSNKPLDKSKEKDKEEASVKHNVRDMIRCINQEYFDLSNDQLGNDDLNTYAYMLRRAIILRAELKKKLKLEKDEELKISEPLAKAFLCVSEYYHEIRSLKAIIIACRIGDKKFHLTQSDLPSRLQLGLQTQEEEFYRILDQLNQNANPYAEYRKEYIPIVQRDDKKNIRIIGRCSGIDAHCFDDAKRHVTSIIIPYQEDGDTIKVLLMDKGPREQYKALSNIDNINKLDFITERFDVFGGHLSCIETVELDENSIITEKGLMRDSALKELTEELEIKSGGATIEYRFEELIPKGICEFTWSDEKSKTANHEFSYIYLYKIPDDVEIGDISVKETVEINHRQKEIRLRKEFVNLNDLPEKVKNSEFTDGIGRFLDPKYHTESTIRFFVHDTNEVVQINMETFKNLFENRTNIDVSAS